MTESTEKEPSTPDIPVLSLAKLAKAAAIALAIAVVLLIFAVLPAEYNIDPTGFGDATGLTRLSSGQANSSSPELEVATEESSEHQVVVEIPPGQGVEYKFGLKTGQKLKYAWENPAGGIYYDFHGEPTGDTTGFFESYAVGMTKRAKGTFTAPFDGIHGWFWDNQGSVAIKINLTTSGSYEVLGLR